MESPTQRLGKYLQELNDSAETLHPTIIQEANIQSAIEISEALTGLTVAVNSMADRVVTVANNLRETLTRTNEVTERAADESTRAAEQSRVLSGKLNKLTFWIVVAAILSAIAACIQAGVTLYAIFHPVH